MQQVSKGLEQPSVHTRTQLERAMFSIGDLIRNGFLCSSEVCGFHPLWVTCNDTVWRPGVS